VVKVVAVGETGAQEHATYVYVIGDVAAGQVTDGDGEVAGEDLDGHGSLLLSDAEEAEELAAASSAS
jgi:hypothetical protein